ncbi:MAG TPA: DsbA family protein [Acidiphilium sp.]|jgi:putative protein-disulfide isomerase|uniref:DsbA family protein n=1 Tax=unclassified Acidiphilium TaxID=2617493 RepID=UPI000BD46F93|nr:MULTISPECIES: DsbA family protein [unclassified Acidiphilium]OYV56300.1 MAG: protein-disulfide isomerase [Acidiphilium sp. 20-67-58]HQT61095.1 DsbA family protein [Acidiphilium sp.]HQU10262.1 DsbA family protein [Acidiphilium sp.]
MVYEADLVYFIDPMCAWCWGFAPVIDAIRARYSRRLGIRIVVGGLLPGMRVPMDAAAKSLTSAHWERVRKASGQSFDDAFFDRSAFVYDTEPACRAIVAARRRSAEDALTLLASIQRSFYLCNEDVTDPVVLAGIAARQGFRMESFREMLCSDELGVETRQDFALTQKSGIAGVPTLVAARGRDRRYVVVTEGFRPAKRIIPMLDRWLQRELPAGGARRAI